MLHLPIACSQIYTDFGFIFRSRVITFLFLKSGVLCYVHWTTFHFDRESRPFDSFDFRFFRDCEAADHTFFDPAAALLRQFFMVFAQNGVDLLDLI